MFAIAVTLPLEINVYQRINIAGTGMGIVIITAIYTTLAKDTNKMKTLATICGIALLAGIPSWWPYDYYVLLRWFIACSGAYIAYGFYKSKLQPWALIFGAITILFNPIAPVYLSKSTWVIIDLITAVTFFLATYSYKSHETNNS